MGVPVEYVVWRVWSMCWGGAKILIAVINDFPAFFHSLSPVA